MTIKCTACGETISDPVELGDYTVSDRAVKFEFDKPTGEDFAECPHCQAKNIFARTRHSNGGLRFVPTGQLLE